MQTKSILVSPALKKTEEAARVERMNKLFIIRAAVEDIIANGLMISTHMVHQSTDVAEIMCSVAAHNLKTAFTVETADEELVGYVLFRDGKHHEVFQHSCRDLDEELDRAFGLINHANDYPGYIGDHPFYS